MEQHALELLNVQEAAEFLKVSISTIRRWAQSKELVGLKVGIRGDWRKFSIRGACMTMWARN